jgi:type I restriction enzyme S subunit
LDEKTELIDKLISTKERKINLLKEQKTSLINQVVTKGLNPNVKMKDSGVEWIGEIPEKWKVSPIKYTLQKNRDSIRTGPFGSSLKSDEFLDEGVRVYNQRSVYDEDFSKSDIFISEEKFLELKGFIVLPGDILITSRGTIGRMTIVPEDGEIGVLHPCLIRLRLNQEILIPSYLWWYINQSSLFITSVKIESNSTTIEVIYSETLSTIRIPIPGIKEQMEIIDFLNLRVKEIDDLVSMEQKKIDLLKEYRQSLISEVVTGKIKVTTDE